MCRDRLDRFPVSDRRPASISPAVRSRSDRLPIFSRSGAGKLWTVVPASGSRNSVQDHHGPASSKGSAAWRWWACSTSGSRRPHTTSPTQGESVGCGDVVPPASGAGRDLPATAARSPGRAVRTDSLLQRHAAADRPASSIQCLPVAALSGSAGMASPQPQNALQLHPANRVTGIFHRLLVLLQERPTLVLRQPAQDPLRVERILTLGRLGAHEIIVTCGQIARPAARRTDIRGPQEP